MLLFALGCATSPEPFRIIVWPDSQNATEKWPELIKPMSEWIVANRDKEDIKYVLHVGDMVQTGNNEEEWQRFAADLREQPLGLASPGDLAEKCDEGRDRRFSLCFRRRGNHTLEALDPAQGQMGRESPHRTGDIHRPFNRSAARPAPIDAALQQHLQRTPKLGRLRCFTQGSDAVHGIDQAIEVEVRVPRQGVRDVADRLFPDQLVGQQDAPNTEPARHLNLVDGRQRDAPGTVLDLTVK